MRKNLLFFFLLFSLFSSFATASSFDQIVMLGDSLSDTGRIYDIFSKAHKTIPLIPEIPKSPPYYQGRFSNGPVWIENVAGALHLKLSDYALGGSWAESFFQSGIVFPWSFEAMLDQYLTENLLDTNKGQHLFMLWGGGNDYLNNRTNVNLATTKTITALKSYIDKLIVFGAKHIVVLNLPDIGQAPYAVKQGASVAANLSRLAALHNAKLTKMIAEEKQKYAGKVDILLMDVYEKFNDIVTNPSKYQLIDVKNPCYIANDAFDPEVVQVIKENMKLDVMHNPSLRTAFLTGNSMVASSCSRPDDFLFWDEVHPTRVSHRIIAGYVLAELKRNHWI